MVSSNLSSTIYILTVYQDKYSIPKFKIKEVQYLWTLIGLQVYTFRRTTHMNKLIRLLYQMSIIEEIESYLEQHRGKQSQTKIGYFEDNADNGDTEKVFKKAWAKLAGLEKLNRLMNYHRIMVGTYNLPKESSVSLQKLFYQNYESMNDDMVEYDATGAKIANIKGLKKDANGNEFYFERNNEKPLGVKIKVSPFKKLEQLKTDAPMHPRKKTVVIKKK